MYNLLKALIVRKSENKDVSFFENYFNLVFHVIQVTSMCKQRGIKLAEGLQTMRRNNAILDDLLAWLNGAEATLMGLDQEPIPGDIQVIMDLLKDHQVRIEIQIF